MCCSHIRATFFSWGTEKKENKKKLWFHFQAQLKLTIFFLSLPKTEGFYIYILSLLREARKWDELNHTSWDSCWKQTPQSLSVYSASLSSTISVCDIFSVFPPNVRSHDLNTDTELGKFDFLFTDFKPDRDQTRTASRTLR